MKMTTTIELNVFARKLASLIQDEIKTYDEECQQHILHHLCDILVPIHPQEILEDVSDTLNYEQAKAFGYEYMPFGKYKGMVINEIELAYLERLFDPNPFMKKLKKYVQFCNQYGYRTC